MPRPKPKDATPVFNASSHALSDEASARLIELLGLGKGDSSKEPDRHQLPGMTPLKHEPDAPILLAHASDESASSWKPDVGKIILDVQQWLGAFPQLEKNVDRAPRAADYVTAFKPLRRDASALLKKLGALNGYLRDQLDVRSIGIEKIEEALRSLTSVSEDISTEFESHSSKGAKKNSALMEVIRRLRLLFRHNYCGPQERRPTRGAFENLSVQERNELDFIYVALHDARIVPKRTSAKAVLRLFKDPRCYPHGSPPVTHPDDAERRANATAKALELDTAPEAWNAVCQERFDVVERIANTAERVRGKKGNK